MIFFEKKEKEAKKENKETVERNKEKGIKKTMARFLLKFPHITEKAAFLAEKNNQYVFRVTDNANKKEIKKAVEDIFGVEVEKVRIANIPSKRKIVKGIEGSKKGYKKAIVQVKQGQKIEIVSR
jgi:large subunit ribosomal protein L23